MVRSLIDLEPRYPWDRRTRETARAFDAFRMFRDLGPRRTLDRVVGDWAPASVRTWSNVWDWKARATSWDDHVARIEDDERLDALRTMHSNHARAARAVQTFAMQVLANLDPNGATPGDVARLLELGAKLERLTLTTSVEELQGRTSISSTEDPWTRIANELSDVSTT